MRLIDADELRKVIDTSLTQYLSRLVDQDDVLEAINNAPTVDAVLVVRCKDCIHHEYEIPGMVYCPHIVGSWVEDMFFCGNGAKMDEEEIEDDRERTAD